MWSFLRLSFDSSKKSYHDVVFIFLLPMKPNSSNPFFNLHQMQNILVLFKILTYLHSKLTLSTLRQLIFSIRAVVAAQLLFKRTPLQLRYLQQPKITNAMKLVDIFLLFRAITHQFIPNIMILTTNYWF